MMPRTSIRRFRCAAFTLVELLVVIGIIALLMGILLPVISRAREQANRTACMSNLREIATSMRMYTEEAGGRLPNSNVPGNNATDYLNANFVVTSLYTRYLKSAAVFHCPSDLDPTPQTIDTADYTLPTSARISYDLYCLWWEPRYGPKLTRLPYNAPLVWDLSGGLGQPDANTNRNHGTRGGNVGMADGHVEWQEAAKWDKTNWPHPADAYYDQYVAISVP
jgi:prepilin-type N-terminal cleavage/methylation domain-containing protein/prepilin-type processing-associated H-X9-DG protein